MSALEQMVTPPSYPYEFSTDVPKDTTSAEPVTTEREIPFFGRVKMLIVGWPDGANNLVGVKFRAKSGERFFPRNREDEYIAANDFTHPFEMNAPINEGSTLVAEFVNNDDANPHFVNVIATIEEIEGGGGE